MSARVLVVDDEATVREELCEALRDAGFACDGYGSGESALNSALNDSYDVCISDIQMPGMDGIELLRRLGEVSPETSVLMITAYGDMGTAIEALRLGAVDYVLKPLLFDDMLIKVRRLVEHRHLTHEVRNLRQLTKGADSPGNMIGESPAMQQLGSLIEKVGPTRSNVMILGESGTGKELTARAIHDASGRQKEPFVPINCAAIPETLLESELFGHAKGAFTGAVSNKEGLLKTAGSGTIFLDELGDMPLSIQAKLLRAIENREIQPVGSVRRIPIEARVVTATNKDLQKEVEAGTFREDLYYRLAVVEIEVPPLRDRRDDIPRLIDHFVSRFNEEAVQHLTGHSWPGNIRELENTIERAMIFSDENLIPLSDLPAVVRGATPTEPTAILPLATATQHFERNHVQKAIDLCEGDKRKAAELLRISLSSLYRKLDLGD